MGISLKGFGDAGTGSGPQIAGIAALPPAAADVRLPDIFADPFAANVSMLLHADDFTDAAGHTITNVNSVTLDTTNKVFGTSSFGLFGDAGAEITSTKDGAGFVLGANDWTIEFRMRHTVVLDNVGRRLIDFVNDGGDALYIQQNRSGADAYIYHTFGGTQIWGGYPYHIPTEGQWYAYALVRDGNTLRSFIDGVLMAEQVLTTQVLNASKIVVGGYEPNTTAGIIGNVDEVRFTEGVARYTAAYDIATEAFPNP